MVGWKQEPLSAVASWFPISYKYVHTLCNEMDVMVECLCLWLSFTVFEKFLEILIKVDTRGRQELNILVSLSPTLFCGLTSYNSLTTQLSQAYNHAEVRVHKKIIHISNLIIQHRTWS